MQPLDRCFFNPLKNLYSKECEKWLPNHPGQVITVYKIASTFTLAYFKRMRLKILKWQGYVYLIMTYLSWLYGHYGHTTRKSCYSYSYCGSRNAVIQLKAVDNSTPETDTQAHQISEPASGNAPNAPDSPTVVPKVLL